MSEPTMEDGTVRIELEGEAFHLRPTPDAIRAICREYGGMNAAFDSIRSGNVMAFEFVIDVGLPDLDEAQRRDLPDKIFRTGYVNLTADVADYLGILLNGGRPLAPDPEDDEGGNKPGEAVGV